MERLAILTRNELCACAKGNQALNGLRWCGGRNPLRIYRTVTVAKISPDELWAKNAGLKNDQKWTYQVNRAGDYISGKLTKYFASEWKGENDKELKIEANLFEFDAGSRAARYFAGFGAGKARTGYRVTVKDAATSDVVRELVAHGTMTMGVFGGDIGTAYDQCTNAIIEYVEAKR